MVVLMKIPTNTSSPLLNQSDHSSSPESRTIHRPKIRVKPPQPQPQTQKRKHFCEVCNKEFSSGKAYGGHVRIHSMEYRNKVKTKIKKGKLKKKEMEMGEIRADVEISCCLCGKKFRKMNSLFGHMRRHPERSWKGVKPPSTSPGAEKFKISSGSSANLDDDDDDDDDVMSRSTVMDDVAEDVQEAAYCLMMLKKAQIDNLKTKRKEVLHEDDSDDEDYDDEEDDDDDDYENDEDNEDDGEMDDKDGKDGKDGKDSTVDMEKKMEIKAEDNENGKRILGFDLNEPCTME